MVPNDATHRRARQGVMTCHMAHDPAHRRALEAAVRMGAERKYPERHYNREEQFAHVEISVTNQAAPVVAADESLGASMER
jgi:hypothetical protein